MSKKDPEYMGTQMAIFLFACILGQFTTLLVCYALTAITGDEEQVGIVFVPLGMVLMVAFYVVLRKRWSRPSASGEDPKGRRANLLDPSVSEDELRRWTPLERTIRKIELAKRQTVVRSAPGSDAESRPDANTNPGPQTPEGA